MTEIPLEQTGRLSPSSIEFWLEEAEMLKETAELSWNADIRAVDRVKLMYSPQHDHVLRQATEELGVELNLLYRYLISLAIQYLAIGILIRRDPLYFLEQPPGHKIIVLVEACDIVLTEQQRQLLRTTENAYNWADRYPAGELTDGHDALRQLTHKLSEMDCLNLEEKTVLDELYAALRAVAKKLVV